ncbi:unnamed protein product [Paramecium pentaurelia]|uniref:Tubulin-tyrosine ligase family protein n=1 Tax=Paramecium pentaurelia TaxID=43138 RepID=A0A8S1UE55_9CILI|nr:unnamed protein product [Paramecium pentaurelia]
MSEIFTLQQLAQLQRNFVKRKIQINLEQTKYKVIDEVVQILDWKTTPSEFECHIFWKDTYVTDEEYRRLLPYQRINHFPGSYMLGKKNELCRNLNKMRKQYPQDYDFYPKTWHLPYQSEELRNKQGTGIFIIKPEANCQGRGIFLTKKLDPFLDKHYVVQEYISNPYLIDGLKFDLRIYVMLKSITPLKIFMYQEGLARFSTKKYVKPQKKNLSSVTMHLTNYAINKRSKDFVFNNDTNKDDVGHKRSLSSVFKYLKEQGHDVDQLISQIKSVIVKTIQSVQPDLAHLYRSQQHNVDGIEQCFELFGFDILLDSNLKPWLLEVNHTPSFSTDTPLDKIIKKNLILDTLILLDIRNKPKKNYLDQKRAPTFQRPPKMSQDEKEKQINQFTIFENKHLNGYVRVYPDENLQYYEQFMPPKQKEKEQTIIIQQQLEFTKQPDKILKLQTESKPPLAKIPKRLSTNKSFTELDGQTIQQLTLRTVAPQTRTPSQQRPFSSIAVVNRPMSAVRKPLYGNQHQNLNQSSNQQKLIYPPPIEQPPKPVFKMLQIKTFSFQKIENTQKNE